MFDWLTRVLGGQAAATPASRPVPAPMPSGQGPGAAPSGQAPVHSQAASAPVFGVRSPLVDTRGGVSGFDYQLPPALRQRLQARADPVASAAHQALLLASMRPAALAGRVALTAAGASMLDRAAVAEQAAAGMLLLVPDLAGLAPQVASALRARGVKLGIADGPPQQAPAADFVLLQGGAGGMDTVLLSAQRWQEARPRLPLLALGLAGVDEVERALQAGVWLAGGDLGRASSTSSRPLNAAAHRICELMNHLALNRDTAIVADAVRADVALSYRLLRYANSPAIGLSRGVETVEQAVMLLGRKELARWLSVMLLSAAGSRPVSRALQEQALARGRLMELLATRAAWPSPEALFGVGVFSMLEALLQVPLAEALAPLRLGEAAAQALLQAQGPWAPLLQLAMALGTVDIDRTENLAEPWGGLEAVQPLADEAWDWAAALLAGEPSA